MDLSIVPEIAKVVTDNVQNVAKQIEPVVTAIKEEAVGSAKGVANLAKLGLSYGPASPLMSKTTKENLRSGWNDMSTEDKAWAVADTAALIPGIGTATKAVTGAVKVAGRTAKMAKAAKTVNKGAKTIKARTTYELAQAQARKAVARQTKRRAITDEVDAAIHQLPLKNWGTNTYQQAAKRAAATRKQANLQIRREKANIRKKKKDLRTIDERIGAYNKGHDELVAEVRRKYGKAPEHVKRQLAKDLAPYAALQTTKNQMKKNRRN